jgi:predicted Zn-dependent protease
VFSLIFLLAGCQGAPPRPADTQIIPESAHQEIEKKLATNLVAKYGAWNDKVAEDAVNFICARIVAADPSLQKNLGRLRIKLLASEHNYSAPGLDDYIFVSKGLLRTVEYENELAFVIATELELMRSKETVKSLTNLQGQEVGENLIVLPTSPPITGKDFLERDWFEPGGLFDFGNEAYLRAAGDAVRLTWSAHYDPRGAVTWVQRWKSVDWKNSGLGKIVPDQEDWLRVVRDEVAKLSPLRDPIVKSKIFSDLQKRLHPDRALKRKK